MTTGVSDDEPPPTATSDHTPGVSLPGVSLPAVVVTDERVADTTPADLSALGALLAQVLGDQGAPCTAEASLTLVDAHAIAALKRAHLDGDGSPTDVLSFPVDGTDPDAELIGDVVLCPSVAAAQASGHAGTIEDELALLVVHGGLHLAGWDHETTLDRAAMWDRERHLMTDLHGAPSLDPWSAQQS